MRFFNRSRRDADLDDEIRSHLAMAERDRVALGESARDAARLARREFGNVAHIKEVTREMWGGLWLERLVQDVRYAGRSLRKNPGFTIVAVLTLALGIGANSAVFTVVNGVILRPLPFLEPHRLYAASYKPPPSAFMPQPGLYDRNFLELQARDPIFERVTTFASSNVTLTGAGDPVRLAGAVVTPDFFPVLGVAPATGRMFAADENKVGQDTRVILSDKLWRARFAGDPRVLGTRISLNSVAYTVVGIMPAGFDFPKASDLWMPLEVRLDPHNTSLRTVVGRLRPGLTPGAADSLFASVSRDFSLPMGAKRDELVAQLVPLKSMLVGDVQRSLFIFAGAVVFVLLIACANVANLLLMRATSREREIAVRSALGAGRSRLVRQLLTESCVVALLGGAIGSAVAVWGVRALIALAPAGKIPRVDEIHVDAAVFAFTLIVSLVTGLVFGLVPAVHATRRPLRAPLSEGARTIARGHGRMRGALVVSEIALALVLLTGAGLMVRSFQHMRGVQLGFRPTDVLTMTVDLPATTYRDVTSIHTLYTRVLDRLAQLPGVEAAGLVNWRPLDNMLIAGDFRLEGGTPPQSSPWADKMAVSPGYFRAMGVRLVEGRAFDARDNAGAPGAVIVSQSIAHRFWPAGNALGKRITMSDQPKPEDWSTIVGVVDDVVQKGVTEQRDPAIYEPFTQVARTFFLDHGTFVVRASSGSAVALGPAMRQVLREADKDLPVKSVASMTDVVRATTVEPLFQARLLGAFSFVALMLAVIGTYGVLAYAVTERRHEIGVRMALGARATDVTAMVLRGSLKLAIPGLVIGLLGARLVTRVLEKLLFGVTPTDPLTFGAVAFVLAGAALLAGWIPARRASRVDPATALRAE